MQEIYNDIFSRTFPSHSQLVKFALARHGFGGDNGYYGLTYPNDIDEYERVVEGKFVPEGKVQINYWDGKHKDILVSEKEYILALKNFLISDGCCEMAELLDTA